MDEQQNNLPGSPSPMNGSPVPPPPPSGGSVDIRTQNSDIQSIKQSGGSGLPQPTQFNLGGANNASATPPSPIPGGPDSGSFPPPPGSPMGDNEPVFNPNQPAPENSSNPEGSSGIDIKRISLIIGVVFAVAVLIWIGYAYVYPLFFGAATQAPIVNNNPSVNGNTDQEAPEVTEIPEAPAAISHSSYLAFPATSADILPAVFTDTYNLNLANTVRSATGLTANSLVEVLVQNSDGTPASFSGVFNNLIPELNKDTLGDLFADDFTAFVYIDENLNPWPGYVARLNPSASLVDAQNAIVSLENSSSLSRLFISDPGTPTAPWRDGDVSGISARYLTYDSGVAIDYLWTGDYFVIVTSYPGIKTALPLLSP